MTEAQKIKSRDYQRDRRKWLKEMGYCPYCGKEKLYGEEKRCPMCMAKVYEANAKYRANNMEKIRKQQRERQKRLRESNLCIQCGEKAKEGHVYCEKHLKVKRKRKQKQDGIGHISRSEYYSYGLCYRCGKPLDSDKRLCKACCIEAPKNFKGRHDNSKHIWRKENQLIKRVINA